MKAWVRFEKNSQTGFGLMENDVITVHTGNMFENPTATDQRVKRDDVRLLTPCTPSKMILLWNNFHALTERLGMPVPKEPLYHLKPANAFIGCSDTIKRPKGYSGMIVYEGELAIVIGRRCKEVSEVDAPQYIFGYTCSNDITAGEIVTKDPAFAQWTRAKGFDTFGAFGPGIVTDINPGKLTIKTFVNGEERQNYPVSDMIFSPAKLVSAISAYMTLEPGDIISCGTSLGTGSMRPGSTVEVVIDGIGRLINHLEE